MTHIPRLVPLLVWAATVLAPSSAQAELVLLNHPAGTYKAPQQGADVKALLDQLPPGTPSPLRTSKSEKTLYFIGRIEGYDTAYAWTPGAMPGKPRTLVFRPRLPNRSLSSGTIVIPVGMVYDLVQEVDHPLDLALLLGDRGYPGSPGWLASLGQAVDPAHGLLPGLTASGPTPAVQLRGGMVGFLRMDLFQGAETDAEGSRRALKQAQAYQNDPSLRMGATPQAAASMLLRGLAELDHFPELTKDYLPAAPDGKPGYEAFRRAIKRCLRFLCRLVAVRPDLAGDLQPRARHFHFAGQAARTTVLSLIEEARSGTLNAKQDYKHAMALRVAVDAVQPDDYFSADDVERFRARFRDFPTERSGYPVGVPVSPTQQAITALQELVEEPSWWVIHPNADDSYAIVSALVGLAPLTDAGGRLLPDPRNADNTGGAGFRRQSSTRKALCGPNGGGVRALTMLLYDPGAGASGDLATKKRDEIAAWAGKNFDARVEEATEVFGTHALRMASGGEYGQRRWVNRALLFAGQSGSLSAEIAAVRRLFSVATQTGAPRPGEPKPEGFDPGSADEFEWDGGDAGGDGTWEAAASGDKGARDAFLRRRAKQQEQAIKTLLTLANFGSRETPAPIARQVLDQLVTLDLRRAQQVATPGELKLLGVVGALENKANKGSDDEWALRARETGRRLGGRVDDRLGKLRSEMAKAEQRLRRAKNSGTPQEEAEAEAEVAELFAAIQTLKRLKR